MTKVIVAGGRVGRNLSKRRVWAIMDARTQEDWKAPITVVHGGAAWVDTWAGEWAKAHGHREIKVAIDNSLDSWMPDAPKKRNRRMYEENRDADECLGFPGGNGTNDMLTICHDAGIPVADVDIEPDGSWRITWWPKK